MRSARWRERYAGLFTDRFPSSTEVRTSNFSLQVKGYREVARELAAARQMLSSQLAPIPPARTVQTSFYKSVVGTRYRALYLVHFTSTHD